MSATDKLRAEWHDICEGMNRGTYRGTEAEALARIDAIKAELASIHRAHQMNAELPADQRAVLQLKGMI
jgi:hypothetical protein